ncbi:MAG: TIGR02147 family protein [Myxococcales bacterium]|nr:TIGR02147 family protein [Myxococcales bacterium]
MGKDGRPRVFEYVDYRRFLADHYDHEKAQRYGFSFRLFSRRAGIRSSNYLRLVIDGERNLSRTMAERFAQGCSLSGAEAEFFCELVEYCQAETTRERSRAYERLAAYRQFRAARRLDAAQAAYHSTWYLPAIRELVRHPAFDPDPKWIAHQLVPPITAREAARALSLLESLGLLVRDHDGQLEQADPVLTTGPGPLGHHIYTYHHMMLERAAAALDEQDREERELSCVTLAVSDDKFDEIKARVRAFRRQLLQEAEREPKPERVVQVNFQLFPLSRAPSADAPTDKAGVSRRRGTANQPRRRKP